MVGKIERKNLIEYKPKNQNKFTDGSFNFKLKYNDRIDLKGLLNNALKKINFLILI